MKATKPTATKPTATKPTATTKSAQAKAIYQRNVSKPRKDVIALFQSEAGLTAAGAATYYQTCKHR